MWYKSHRRYAEAKDPVRGRQGFFLLIVLSAGKRVQSPCFNHEARPTMTQAAVLSSASAGNIIGGKSLLAVVASLTLEAAKDYFRLSAKIAAASGTPVGTGVAGAGIIRTL